MEESESNKELDTQIFSTKEQIKSLENLLEQAKLHLAALQSKRNGKKVECVPNETVVDKVILRFLIKSEENERWIDCGTEDVEKEVALVKENYKLDGDNLELVRRYIQDFKKMNAI
ncbi:hypothetical protein EIN_080280 [Entamoeba invadens IP1]|uniref:hypothetical protein n=1 Tax=Entamoeba invadens IP1 TaxID=370355 RepID=UPI0002C3E3F4|nr:hypothetical protein EIN_080280 [Entamoeba invadens IP1]ELP85076.1 hypothetical protein EIN_080280 [Entamoeba invadens IP1]|eukprot:XP_004184422.1 hypothetical protein EIN_080280 [Entamoeba invadens IP1]